MCVKNRKFFLVKLSCFISLKCDTIHGDFPVLNEFQKREVFEGERVSQFHKGLKAQVWIIHQMEIFLYSVLSGKPKKTGELHNPPQLASEFIICKTLTLYVNTKSTIIALKPEGRKRF